MMMNRAKTPSRYYGSAPSVPGPVPGSVPGSLAAPTYTMLLRRHRLGWQFLGSIEENAFWYLPHTQIKSFTDYFAGNPIRPTVIQYKDQFIAVYICTDDNFRCPWKIVQKDTRRSFVPLRDWIFVSELFLTLDSEHPTVWGRRVHRILPEIFNTCLFSYLGVDPLKKDYPLVLYHGTNMERARGIMKDGFKVFRCVHEGGSHLTTEIVDKKFVSDGDECRCRMMGPGVYGASFVRSQLFAQKKFGNQACIVRFVVENSVSFYCVRNTDVCGCSCKQPYVDHVGELLRKHGAVYLSNNSYPATSSPEWVIADVKNVQATNFIFFPPKITHHPESGPLLGKRPTREWGGEDESRPKQTRADIEPSTTIEFKRSDDVDITVREEGEIQSVKDEKPGDGDAGASTFLNFFDLDFES